MKTIKEWFESVENPILRKVLLMRLHYNSNSVKLYSLYHAIEIGLKYGQLPEGSLFWEKVVEDLKTSNESPTFNAKYSVMQVEWLDENECIVISNVQQAKQLDKQIGKDNFIKNRFYSVSNTLWYFPYTDKSISALTNVSSNTKFYPAKLFIKDMKQDLLEETKLRYPIGCKFKSEEMNRIYTVTSNDFYYTPPNKANHKGILVSCNNSFGQHIYYENNWTEYLEVFGFKVGDVIDKDILNKCKHETKIGDKWIIHDKDWGWSPTIDKIEFIDNCICLKTNNNVYFKAEGLREFIELEKLKQDAEKAKKEFIECLNEFNKKNMKQEFVLPEKWYFKPNNKEEAELLGKYIDSYENWATPGFYSSNLYKLIDNGFSNERFGYCKGRDHTELTFEQFKQYVLKQKNMKLQTLTLGQLKELRLQGNCNEWTLRINSYIDDYRFAKDNTEVKIKLSDLDYAKQNASKAQLKLLQDAGLVFKEDCPYKVGDWVVVNCSGKQYVEQVLTASNNPLYITTKSTLSGIDDNIRKATEAEIKYAQIDWDKLKTGSVVKFNCTVSDLDKKEPVKIVLYNSKYVIDKGKFDEYLPDIYPNRLYTTVYQNNKFCAILEENFKSFVSEVISY